MFRAKRTVLSVSDILIASDTSLPETILTISGQGSPVGARVIVTVLFEFTNDEFFGETEVQADGSWTVSINVGTESGPIDVEVEIMALAFPGVEGTGFAIGDVPATPDGP